MSKLRRSIRGLLPPAFLEKIRVCRGALLSAAYVGGSYSCNICDKSFRKFLDAGVRSEVFNRHNFVGSGIREQVRCPGCGSVERERLLYMFLNEHNQSRYLDEGAKVLHFAPERHIESLFRHSLCDYTTADLFSTTVDKNIDVKDIPYPSRTFDMVICNHVLEHVDDDRKAVSEIARVLKPDGICVLQVPYAVDVSETVEDFSIVSEAGREAAFGQFDHVRIYGRDYLQRFDEGGLDVDTWLPDNEILQKMRLNGDEYLNIGRARV